jgi:hypothetical protein
MPGEATPGCKGTGVEPLGGAACAAQVPITCNPTGTCTHKTTSAREKGERRTVDGTAADDDASSLTRRGCRRRRSRTCSRCRRNAGESRLPRSSPLLCACGQHAGSQHWSHRSHPGGAGAIACASCVIGQAQNARERAHERRWGDIWRVGMGCAAHRKSSIFECPVSFSELTNASQLQHPASPCFVVERKSLTGALPERLELVDN